LNVDQERQLKRCELFILIVVVIQTLLCKFKELLDCNRYVISILLLLVLRQLVESRLRARKNVEAKLQHLLLVDVCKVEASFSFNLVCDRPVQDCEGELCLEG